jgi:hypothetical protein
MTNTVSIDFTLNIKQDLYRQKHNNINITHYHSKTIHGKKKEVALPLFPVYRKVNKLKICVHTTCDSSEQKPFLSNKYTMHFASTMIIM